MSQEFMPQCAACPYEWAERYCRSAKGKGPENCPSIRHRKLVKQAQEILDADTLQCELARQSSIQESEGYGDKEQGYWNVRPIKPRILEIMEFAQKMGFKRLGVVFCVGLRNEAAMVHRIFTEHGFETASIICKVGRVKKSSIGLERHQHVDPNVEDETMCHPVLQALVANAAKVDFNVLLGLCVGHDSLFIKHAEAPVTVLAVKDRMLGHNPLAALYQYDQYYRSLKKPLS